MTQPSVLPQAQENGTIPSIADLFLLDLILSIQAPNYALIWTFSQVRTEGEWGIGNIDEFKYPLLHWVQSSNYSFTQYVELCFVYCHTPYTTHPSCWARTGFGLSGKLIMWVMQVYIMQPSVPTQIAQDFEVLWVLILVLLFSYNRLNNTIMTHSDRLQ